MADVRDVPAGDVHVQSSTSERSPSRAPLQAKQRPGMWGEVVRGEKASESFRNCVLQSDPQVAMWDVFGVT